MRFIMGTDALRLFKENVGDEAYVETPLGKFTPFMGVPIFTDCRIEVNSVFFDWPEMEGPHSCSVENSCSARIREEMGLHVSSD